MLATNLAFRETVRRLYQKEEQRIAADYQRIFDLEREVPVDVQLDQELTLFRQQVERFERRLQQDEMRLDELVELRERARSLIPRLSTGNGAGDAAGSDGSEAEGEAETGDRRTTPTPASACVPWPTTNRSRAPRRPRRA